MNLNNSRQTLRQACGPHAMIATRLPGDLEEERRIRGVAGQPPPSTLRERIETARATTALALKHVAEHHATGRTAQLTIAHGHERVHHHLLQDLGAWQASHPQAVAAAFVAASACVAAFMSLASSALSRRGVPTPTTAAACGAVACVLSLGLTVVQVGSRGLSGAAPPCGAPLVAVCALGGVLPHLAFLSISRSGLAVANCLMFTMPLWTSGFSAFFAGHAFGARDVVLSSVSMLGVVLVTQPPPLWESTVAATPFSPTGVAAGLAFGACGGGLNVLIHAPSLRTAQPTMLTAYQMAATVALALPALMGAGSNAPGYAVLGGLHVSPALLGLLGLVGVLQTGQRLLRTVGLQRARSPTVAMVLYTEIAWAFALDVLVLGSSRNAGQFAGAALIIGGAVAHAVLPENSPQGR